MKNSISKNILVISSVVLGLSLFHFDMVKFGIIFFLISILINFSKNKMSFLITMVAISPFLSVFFSNLYNGFDMKWLERRFSFVLFPIIFFYCLNNEKFLITKKYISKGFVYGSIGASLIIFIYALYNVLEEGTFKYYDETEQVFKNYFLHHSLSKPLELHPSYLSVYLSFSILLIIKGVVKLKSKIISVIATCFLFTILFLLQSKILIGIVLISLFYIIKKEYIYSFKLRLFYSVTLIVLTGFIFSLSRFQNLTFTPPDRVTQSLYINKGWNPINVRVKLNEVGIGLINEFNVKEVIFGIGKERLREALKHIYKEQRITFFSNKEYILHNQYLSEFLQSGIIGFLCLFFFFLFLLKKIYVSKKSKEYLLILMAIIIYCFFEEFMNLQTGILFFSLFTSIYLKQLNFEKPRNYI